MSQFDDNLSFRLARLEQKLEAYRKLHASELEEIMSALADLRQELMTLAKSSQLGADRLPSTQDQLAGSAEDGGRVRWTGELRSGG